MRSFVFIFATVSLIISTSNAVKWGGCPTLNYQDNFDISKYLGTWYEAARMKGTPFQHGDCARAQYSQIDDTYVKVFNSGLTADGELDPIQGQVYCDKYPAAACHVRFSSYSPWGSYNVLSTDYDTYTVVYSCSDFIFFHFEQAWVLARSQRYDITSSGQLNTLAKVGVTEDEMQINDIYNCSWP